MSQLHTTVYITIERRHGEKFKKIPKLLKIDLRISSRLYIQVMCSLNKPSSTMTQGITLSETYNNKTIIQTLLRVDMTTKT
jgi:hypothetical protein